MYTLTISEFFFHTDAATQKFDPAHVSTFVWHPCAALQSFEEACQELKTQLFVFAAMRGCDMALVAELDFTELRYQRVEGWRQSVELMPVEDERVRITLKVSCRAPWNENIDLHYAYALNICEQQ
jgi:hypothetical protein